MTTLPTLYQQLRQYHDFTQEENEEKFLHIVDEIVLQEDPACIPELLKYLDDKGDTYVMQSLMIAIEHFDPNTYCKFLLDNIESVNKNAPYWLKALVYGILNNPAYLQCFRRYMHIATSDVLRSIFDNIERESLEHTAIIKTLKEELTPVTHHDKRPT